jgi:hypothetical protein
MADGRHAFAETGRHLPYRQKDEAPGHEEHLYELSRRTRRVPGKVVLRDYDFERPMLDLTVTAEDGKGEEVGEEVYGVPGRLHRSRAREAARPHPARGAALPAGDLERPWPDAGPRRGEHLRGHEAPPAGLEPEAAGGAGDARGTAGGGGGGGRDALRDAVLRQSRRAARTGRCAGPPGPRSSASSGRRWWARRGRRSTPTGTGA